MQEECDFQIILEKKLSAEGRLDAAASSTNLSETEIKKLVRICSYDRLFSILLSTQCAEKRDKLMQRKG
ncbi:hypothetical protein K0M31_006580 [Melipona bicolor]|uniref:Uncharacterized protein n=1 Tax=Melipona bicolor TaxID=60889 RepID=A0AA40FRU8_9HYME|nr:hypothetical protein K0M31_006580 [Melipona bicolor]